MRALEKTLSGAWPRFPRPRLGFGDAFEIKKYKLASYIQTCVPDYIDKGTHAVDGQ